MCVFGMAGMNSGISRKRKLSLIGRSSVGVALVTTKSSNDMARKCADVDCGVRRFGSLKSSFELLEICPSLLSGVSSDLLPPSCSSLLGVDPSLLDSLFSLLSLVPSSSLLFTLLLLERGGTSVGKKSDAKQVSH